MFIAYDATDSEYVSAAEAKAFGGRSHVYICPNKDCSAKLILRAGEVKVEHFAHPANLTEVQRACVAESEVHKENDLSDWKKHWTQAFNPDRLERMIKLDGKYKRADALFEESRTVVQLQHTVLRRGEFASRNDFFLRAGYRSVWVIDGSVLIGKGWMLKKNLWELSEAQRKISKEKNQYHFNFSRWEAMFGDYDPELDLNIVVYVAVPATNKEGKRVDYLYRIVWLSPKEKSSFSAQYTPQKVFFGDCAGTMPLSKEEADKAREKVLSNRAESTRRWQAYQERLRKEEEGRRRRELEARQKAEAEARGRAEEEKKRRAEEFLRWQAENRERLRKESEERQRVERKKREKEEADRKREAEEREQRVVEFARNLPEMLNQQDDWVVDADDNRWIRCERCGKIATTGEFWTYGGAGKMNIGICYDCQKR